MHLLKNPTLACSVEAHLHPAMVPHLPALWAMGERLPSGLFPIEPASAAERRALRFLAKGCVAPNVYCLPLLSPVFCDALLVESRTFNFQPNAEEAPAYQIPEAVLAETCPQLNRTLVELFRGAAWPMLAMLDARSPAQITSVQLAKYTPLGTAHGNWHHDEDSDQTVVVSLAPELHTGGGTELMLGSAFQRKTLNIPPLPKGHALFFRGKFTLHRGLAVESGERNLLVYWTEAK